MPRRLFDPVAGTFRRLEREASILVSRHVFPRIPGIHRIYDALLASGLTVAETEIVVPGLSPAFDGATVLLVTDLHAGPLLSVAGLRRALDRLLTLEPDLILLGGDFVTTRLEEILPHGETLRALRAPLGTFAVLGNHDHYCGEPEALRAVLATFGVHVLHNDATRLHRGDGRLALCGIDDFNAGRPDLEAALAAASAIGGPSLLLSHNPDVFFAAVERGVAVVLSGHTHGGQLRIPGLPVLVRMSRYRLDEGRYASGGGEIVVSRGLGVTGLPLRLGCRPEAVFLRLLGA